ncbi:MAG TPA: hypothetical protein DDZ41_04295 [Flavobacterium sp.]|nr:hypothetical protein [Flavobacterium sp.]
MFYKHGARNFDSKITEMTKELLQNIFKIHNFFQEFINTFQELKNRSNRIGTHIIKYNGVMVN